MLVVSGRLAERDATPPSTWHHGVATDATQLSQPHDWRALEAKWMGVGRATPEGKYRRIGMSERGWITSLPITNLG
jgi:hypothetical protein